MKILLFLAKCVRIATVEYLEWFNTDPRGSIYDGALIGIPVFIIILWVIHYLIAS